MDQVKNYGYRAPKQTSYHANHAEFRMISILAAYSLALLFGNGLLVLWGLWFFVLGLVAEVYPKPALKTSLVFTGLLALSPLTFINADHWLSSGLFAAIIAWLALDGLKTRKIT